MDRKMETNLEIVTVIRMSSSIFKFYMISFI